jgi:hypothetical protein
MGQNDLAYLAGGEVASSATFAEKCHVQHADASVANKFVDRVDEQVAKFRLRYSAVQEVSVGPRHREPLALFRHQL